MQSSGQPLSQEIAEAPAVRDVLQQLDYELPAPETVEWEARVILVQDPRLVQVVEQVEAAQRVHPGSTLGAVPRVGAVAPDGEVELPRVQAQHV